MNTLAIINSVDITSYINWKTYTSESEEMFESWRDGNFVEHRIYTRSHLIAAFDVWLCGMDNMDTDTFMALWNSAVNNHVITIGLFDHVHNRIKAVEGYYTITPSDHKEMMNGEYFDVFHIEVTER